VRIGVNALYLIPGGVGGTEIYLRSLLEAMTRIAPEHEYKVFVNRETEAAPLPGSLVKTGVRASNRPSRIAWEQIALPRRLSDIDVLFNPGFTAPAACPCPTVTVFHDLQHKRHPEHFGVLDLAAWRFFLWQSAHLSSRLIAVSEATRQDLLRFYSIRADKIEVIHHGVDAALSRLHRRPEQMILCVSTLHPHKNLVRLVRVFGRFHADFPESRLILAGMRGFHARQVEDAVNASPARDAITITGWIPREQLLDLYARAGIFVYPSTFEGFGMPVLEALAAGIPTACSDIPPLREIAQSDAVFFDPVSDGSMFRALEDSLEMSVDTTRARSFTWERCARHTLRALATAAGLRAGP
jgi:glycosyltransferase involved in cell wall biosynthesis